MNAVVLVSAKTGVSLLPQALAFLLPFPTLLLAGCGQSLRLGGESYCRR